MGVTTAIPGRLAATAAGLALSRLVPPLPDEVHPVARFGATMTGVEEMLWQDDRTAGLAYAAAGAGLGMASGRAAPTAATVAVCVAGRQLRDVAWSIADDLESGRVAEARAALPALVGRRTDDLDEAGVAAACIESVAENMVDAVVGPAFWGGIAGGTGVALHRALNTMDAMVGRRDHRYERFGWAAARADDLANLVPARIFATCVALARPDRRREIVAAVRRDAPAHPSPNAGVAEAAVAAALGVELGGPVRYGDVEQDRPILGSGPRPGVEHVRATVVLSRRIEDGLVVALAAGALVGWLGCRR